MTAENEDVPSRDGKGLSRKEREREQHRLEILDAAERVFVRDGYHETTVESIAKEAEFAVGTLYNFFSGKEDLYAAVMRRISQDLLADFERDVLSKEDPVEAVGAVFDLNTKYAEKHRDFFGLIIATGPKGLEAAHADMKESHDRFLGAITDILDRGMQRGIFVKDDPLFVALCLEGICHAIMLYWAQHRPGAALADLAQRAKAGFIEQIRVRTPAGPGAPGTPVVPANPQGVQP